MLRYFKAWRDTCIVCFLTVFSPFFFFTFFWIFSFWLWKFTVCNQKPWTWASSLAWRAWFPTPQESVDLKVTSPRTWSAHHWVTSATQCMWAVEGTCLGTPHSSATMVEQEITLMETLPPLQRRMRDSSPARFAMSARPPTGPAAAPRTFRLQLHPFLQSLRMPFPSPGWTWTHPTAVLWKCFSQVHPKHQRAPHTCMVSPVVFTFVSFRFKCRSEVMGVLCVQKSLQNAGLMEDTTVWDICFERSWKWMKSL